MKRTFSAGMAAALLVGCVGAGGRADGAIIYDNITTNSWSSSIFSDSEYADDTTLSTGAGSVIRQVEVGVLRSTSFPGAYSGTMTVNLWADAGGAPGALLGTSAVPIVLSDNVPHIVAAPFASIVATTATIWTGVSFSFTTQLGAGIVQGTAAPSVGSTTGWRARRNPDDTWQVFNVGLSNEFLRIDTVPGPGVLVAMAGGVLVVGRRRRTP